VSRDNYPQIREHPLNRDSFMSLTKAAEVAGKRTMSQDVKKHWTLQGPGRLLFEALGLCMRLSNGLDEEYNC
jgi:hypothetical protein